MLESEEQGRAKMDQVHALEQTISVLERFAEGVAAQKILNTANDENMAEAHFFYFKQMEWIEQFRGSWYITDVGKTVLTYLKLKQANVNQ
ncbi:MAG: hypothetical protein ABI347_03545 [Nitrososphaera sp.]|jgi:hypothetical protein